MSARTPLSKVRGLGSAKSGTHHFWHQRLTALANLPLVIAFLVIIVSLLGRDHASVVVALGHPVVALILIMALLSVSWHMKLGMQVIIEDYVHSEGQKLALIAANNFFCAAVVLAGIFAVLKLSFGVSI